MSIGKVNQGQAVVASNTLKGPSVKSAVDFKSVLRDMFTLPEEAVKAMATGETVRFFGTKMDTQKPGFSLALGYYLSLNQSQIQTWMGIESFKTQAYQTMGRALTG